MKLIYLWIEHYRNIKEQGYLLNAGYDIKYDKTKHQLSISERASLDKILYGDKISVAAIVGDNGAGKSTLLDAIRMVLFDEDRRKKEIAGFLVWENEGKLGIFSFMEEEKSLKIDMKGEISQCSPDDFCLIYYSDFLDEKYYLEEFDEGGSKPVRTKKKGNLGRSSIQSNISTSYLLRKDKGVLDFFHGDTRRQLDFYGSLREKAQQLPFSAPVNLSIKIEFLELDIFDRVLDSPLQAYEYKGMGHHGEINTTSHMIGLLKGMDAAYRRKTIWQWKHLNMMSIFQWNIFASYLYNLLAKRKREHRMPHNYDHIDKNVKCVISKEIDANTFWEELEKIFSKESTEEDSFKDYLIFYHKTNQILKCPKNGTFRVEFRIPEYIKQLLIENPSIFGSFLTIPKDFDGTITNIFQACMDETGWNGNWNREEFMRLYDSYTKIFNEIDFLKCSWGMSSGESSMFNLFSRLHEVLHKWEQRKFILILDELDSCFHPQWQQKIMNFLTEFLRTSYSQKEFQIILTTHSPVLLSDIPRDNVIFMRREGVVEKEHKQTFAANIASLYYDSFFMKNGSIGEVAKNSIAHLLKAISELEGKKPESDRECSLLKRFLQEQYQEIDEGNLDRFKDMNKEDAKNLLQMLIDHIGEDIWRYKVNERFHCFLEDDPENREREIWHRLDKLSDEKGKEAVRELLKQYLREEN